MTIPPSILIVIYGIVFIVVCAASIAFIYHWYAYGTDAKAIRKMSIAYSAIAAGLLLIAWMLLQTSLS
ncbi:MAG: hypothetical protein HYT27_00050 [Parcubacteria group bacterium]|nr:hypothetical protein [Parcubacteria group bacterium]